MISHKRQKLNRFRSIIQSATDRLRSRLRRIEFKEVAKQTKKPADPPNEAQEADWSPW